MQLKNNNSDINNSNNNNDDDNNNDDINSKIQKSLSGHQAASQLKTA